MIQAGINSSYNGGSTSDVAVNSLALDTEYFLTKTGDTVDKAGVGTVIAGVNYTIGTFASDNQTVDFARVEYAPTDLGREYEVTITGGTITAEDEGKFFDLTAAGNVVDGATESATTGQVLMTRFISATKSAFKIANA